MKIDSMERGWEVLDSGIWLQCLILQLVITMLIVKRREPQFPNVKDNICIFQLFVEIIK